MLITITASCGNFGGKKVVWHVEGATVAATQTVKQQNEVIRAPCNKLPLE
jgi:hypothetical protein